jgi:thiol-disulfide isomerase/thioredoxin
MKQKMKKVFVISTFLLGLSVCISAQNRSIVFEETKEWKKVVQKAKKAKKLIFLDCYTSWCGPCKALERNIFTQDSVADFYNRYFVNAKLEMEKDADGILLRKKYNVTAYPTLLFIDPVTQEVQHRIVGSGKAAWLIAGGEAAKNPDASLSSLTKRYQQGERSHRFIQAYTKALKTAYLQDERSKVTEEYLHSLTADQLATPENWVLIRENIQDPLSRPLREVMANRPKFYAVAGQNVVDAHLENSISSAAVSIASWQPGGENPFKEDYNRELIAYLKSIDFKTAPSLAWLQTAELIRKKEWKNVLDKIQQTDSDSIFDSSQGFRYFQFNIESLADSGDTAVVRKGVALIDKKIAETTGLYRKADYSQSKYRLLTSINDILGADKAKMEEEAYTKEGTAETGGRVIRAIRMN